MVRATRRPAVLALVAAFFVSILPGGAQPVLAAGTISLIGVDVQYTQDFDTLALSGTSSTVPNGWDFSEGGTNANTTYTAGTGSANAGDTYSFGASGSTDRAFGGLLSGSLVPTIGVSFTNGTGATLTALDVAYTGEQWRVGALGRPDRLDFQLSTNATSLATGTWSDHDTLDFTAPVTTGTVGALDGNAASNRTAIAGTIGDLSIANGATFWIRWTDFNAAGADDGLAVDDFSLTPRVSAGDAAPSVASTNPVDGATNVPVDATISVTFSEPVTLDAGAATLNCTPNAPSSIDSGPATTFEFLLLDDLPEGADCTIDVDGSKVHDVDTDDPPDTMVGTFSASFTVFSPVVAADVNISQVYGGGGNAGATYKNDFIELFNPGADDVDLSGWSVQYASSAGSSWQVTPLGLMTASIPAGKHYLVQEGAGAGGTVDLPDPDAVGTIAMAAGSGKVALVASTTPLSGTCPLSNPDVIDFVGYGTANCFEGAGAAPTLSNTTAALRKGDGAIDTDNNSDDFEVGDPNPRASKDSAPRVASSFPADGAAGVPVWANLTITFSEPVDVTGAWYEINCATSGTHAATVTGGPAGYTLNPSVDFAGGETCTLTIEADNVTDVDTDDPPDTMAADAVFSFTVAEDVACGDPATLISAVQGAGLSSPLANSVVEVEAVVVGSYLGPDKLQGFHVQEEDADHDADPATSEGLFIFEPNGGAPAVAPGDTVRVKGKVTEFNTSGVTLTELANLNNLVVCGSGASATPASVSLPFASPTFAERYESMLVTIDQELTVTETFTLGRFGEVVLSSDGRLTNPTNIVAPGAPANALQAQNNLRRIVLDDGDGRQNIDPTVYPTGGLSALNTLRVGYTTDGGTFVLEQRFGGYRLQPTAALAEFEPANPRQAAPDGVGGQVRVASFNVLNYFNGDGLGGGFPTARGAETPFELERQRAKIISALVALDADIVGVNELENDAGPNSAIADLVAGLNDASAPGTYAYIDTGIVGTDEIRVAFLYQPAVVTPIGGHAILDSTVDPRFIDTLNRPAVAQTFERNATGSRVTVVANHLKSKGSACTGDPDAGDGQGNCNGTRTLAAEALVDWLATDPTGNGGGMNLIIGDLNSYAKEDPITAIKDAGYTNLLEAFVGEDAYSYVFEGQSGYLDHALANAELLPEVSGVTEWHINADEPPVLDYNVNFKSPGHVETLYAPDAYRSSDHDPVLIGLVLAGAPTVDGGGPYQVIEGGSGTLSATGTEPDGAALAYDWDLDGDGTFETPGQSVTFSAAALEAPDSVTVAVRATGPTGLTATDTATVEIVWDFGGFTGPVTGRPFVETAKAGQSIAIRFALGGDQGLAIVADGYPTSGDYTCGETPLDDATEPAVGEGLTYDPSSGLYTYAWKSEKGWANTCRTFVLKLADGTYHYVDVHFRK